MKQKSVIPPSCSVIILCHSDKRDGKRTSGSGPIEPLIAFFTAQRARYIFVIEQKRQLNGQPREVSIVSMGMPR